MAVAETALIYGVLGLAVAAALAIRLPTSPARAAAWAALWPFYAPLLFADPPPAASAPVQAARGEVEAAWRALPEPARATLAPEVERVLRLTDSLGRLAAGVRSMDAVLASPAFDRERADDALAALEGRGCEPDDPRLTSLRARIANIERLQSLRAARDADVHGALLTLEALTTELRLLGCTGGADPDPSSAIQPVVELARALAEGLFAPDEALL